MNKKGENNVTSVCLKNRTNSRTLHMLTRHLHMHTPTANISIYTYTHTHAQAHIRAHKANIRMHAQRDYYAHTQTNKMRTVRVSAYLRLLAIGIYCSRCLPASHTLTNAHTHTKLLLCICATHTRTQSYYYAYARQCAAYLGLRAIGILSVVLLSLLARVRPVKFVSA